MAKEAYLGLVDVGATWKRAAIADMNGLIHDMWLAPTKRESAEDFDGEIQWLADRLEKSSQGGELVSISSSVAATVTKAGELTVSGALSKFRGRNLKTSMAAAAGLPVEMVGAWNDMEVVAMSQHDRNLFFGIPMDGEVFTLSSGFGGATYTEDGVFVNVEPGHEHLRYGAKCPCGQEGHVEAFISGVGIEENQGVSMQDYLKNPQNALLLANDLSESLIAQIERQRNQSGFMPKEVRWTGSVALNHPFTMQSAASLVREAYGDETPVIGVATMLDRAGLHGTMVDAKRLALAA